MQRSFLRGLAVLTLGLALTACSGGTPTPTGDTTKPTLSASAAPTTTNASITVSGTSSDNVGVTAIEYTLNGGARQSVTVGDTFSFPAALNVGSNTIVVYAKDAAGNETSTTLTVTRSNAPDTTAPTIVSVSPANAATGVAKDANIVVTFSEPMNQASAQAAFQSADVGASTITWSAGGTVMTVNPNADLAYTAAGKSYGFQVTNTATDLAGNALSNPANATFKTYKQLSATLPIKATSVGEISNTFAVNSVIGDILVGDFTNNTSRRGFVGFDISSLPSGLDPNNVLSARLRMYVNSPIVGTPFTNLFPASSCSGLFCVLLGKSVVLEHVTYGNTIVGSAYNIAPLSTDVRGLTDETPCGSGICFFVGTTTGWNASDISPWLKDDLTNRAARGNLSEVRMKFPIDTNGDNASDYIAISNNANKAQLVVTYLIP
ncbi:hypothetical protein EHF33_02320 [Deinococcus psychrotolerans]|uniref:SbsA Ig-like domain-containing protein n=1 Tax=Deinococcus psychrotolerans TaxID=2489213 RepID=A0A3G8Y9Y3_9DEIO|nr:Ig-like domain-containing protein [Deinococcus psychrotolerans]AZI41723.1 hypothetical protein EHF33_02320 [Deinococcus psychrotolerans]